MKELNNYFNEIDKNRLKLINVDYDKEFIEIISSNS